MEGQKGGVMRIALLADIHGNLAALRAVLADVEHRAVDQIVNLGDHLSGPLQARETAELLMAQPWVQIAGNHERQLLTFAAATGGASDRHALGQLTAEQLAWVRSLPSTARLEDGVLLCHGTPRADSEYWLETVEPGGVRPATAAEIESRLGDAGGAVIACGHTHVPRAIRTRGGRLVVNPGSVGLPAYDDVTPFPHVIETGSPDARYALLESHHGIWSAAMLCVPYDFERMAELAERNGRPEWAYALRTGYAMRASA